ncbi:MAG: FxsA family protein [Nitriliruptorales bacterium]|nr:FxsA family protein [Nitriliruptorales bacterium]
MPLLLLILFLAVPLIEVAVIVRVGAVLGFGWTITLLLADSMLGAWLVQREGRRAWHQFREALADARWPALEVAEGALVLIGGALLVTPGFVTDGVGLLFVLPPTRRALASFLEGRVVPMPLRAVGNRAFPGRSAGDVMEVEVISVEREEVREPGEQPGNEGGPRTDSTTD